MCDYSLQDVKSRPAVVDDKIITNNFGAGTRGFAPQDDATTAVCLLPGTELAFDAPITGFAVDLKNYTTAIFRQINKDQPYQHHDALELPNGQQLLLTFMKEGQKARVLQLPAPPTTEQEAKDQQRLEMVDEWPRLAVQMPADFAA